MNENQEAQALARWLEEHPGQAPPPDVDPEVIEALYALRPDLAPPPNVRIEDIFAAVESGPFASRDENEVTEEVVSLEAERAKRVPNEVAPASRTPARRASWWSAPGMGALLAAALALVVILPTAGILLTQKTADFETATPAASPPAPAQEVGADTVTPSLQAAPEEAAPASEAAAPAAAEPPARRDSNELLRQEAKKSDGTEDDRGAVGDLAAPADAAKPATIEGERDAETQTEAIDDLDEQTLLEKTQPEAKMKSEEAEPAKEIESYGAAGAGPSASSTRSNMRAKDAPAPAAPPAEALAADESSTPSPYGDISGASTDAALTAATDDSDDRKAMTAAWFLAQRQYDRGDPDAAMATITKGLRRSGNDDLRSDLTALQWTVAQSMRPAAAPVTDDQ